MILIVEDNSQAILIGVLSNGFQQDSAPFYVSWLLEQIMHVTPDSSQQPWVRAQFLQLAKEAEIAANTRRCSAITERYLHHGKSILT